MMATLIKDILPYRLKRRRWKTPKRYSFIVKQKKKIGEKRSSLRCTIPITLTMINQYEKSAVFRLQMERPSFNGSGDYDKLQWIFAKLMSLSRDIHVRTHPNGTVWEILNKQQIQKRWPLLRQQILDMYEDPLVENIIARHEQNLTHHFDSLYKHDPSLQFLFNDLFHRYAENKSPQTEKILSKHFGHTPLPVIEQKKLIRLKSLKDQAVIATKGKPYTDRIDQEAINNYLGSLLGNYPTAPYRLNCEGQYQMNTDKGCIHEASLEITGTLGETYEKHINYHLTQPDYE